MKFLLTLQLQIVLTYIGNENNNKKSHKHPPSIRHWRSYHLVDVPRI